MNPEHKMIHVCLNFLNQFLPRYFSLVQITRPCFFYSSVLSGKGH